MKFLKFSGLMMSLFLTFSSNAQDYRFSQFYNAPLNLNPALTGKINSVYRLVANYRVQSAPVASPAPYNTLSASADFGLMRKQLKGDILGVGIIVSADNQAGGVLKTTDVMASLAYHKSFGYENNHYLSAGFQFGLKNRRLDISQLVFESQFNQAINGFDRSLSSLENFDRLSNNALNLNAGIFWSSNFTDNISAYAGASMFNLMRPKDSFFASDSEREIKLHTHGGMIFTINKMFMISPNGIFMTQQTAKNWVAGSSFGINLSGQRNPFQTLAFLGAWYEGNGALIGSAGIQHKGFQVGLSYDQTVSDLKQANNGFGAFEISLIYVGKSVDMGKKYPILYCPRF